MRPIYARKDHQFLTAFLENLEFELVSTSLLVFFMRWATRPPLRSSTFFLPSTPPPSSDFSSRCSECKVMLKWHFSFFSSSPLRFRGHCFLHFLTRTSPPSFPFSCYLFFRRSSPEVLRAANSMGPSAFIPSPFLVEVKALNGNSLPCSSLFD